METTMQNWQTDCRVNDILEVNNIRFRIIRIKKGKQGFRVSLETPDGIQAKLIPAHLADVLLTKGKRSR